jgi:acetoacetyl-CoA reductase
MSTNRIALVTGGAGGLGTTICTKLNENGYRVVLTHSPSNTTIKETLAELKGRGHDFHAYPVDVADYDRSSGVAAIRKDIGPIDILINNAGITT